MDGKDWGIAAAALAAALAAGTNADAECRMSKYFDLPVTMEGRAAVVSTKINGQEARFEVDTGAFYSMLTPDAAKRLNVRGVPTPSLTLHGVGGEEYADVGEAKEFNFAGVPLKGIYFVVGGRQFQPGTIGLLGENMLSFADVEYDFAHGMMRFFKVEGCYKYDLAYWAKGGAYDSVSIDAYAPPASTNLRGRVKINGHWIDVMFDSGSSVSLLTRRAAERAGVDMNSPDVKQAGLTHGIGHGVVETWTAPIDSFSIGSEEIKNTRLTIGKLELGNVDMLLGMDFFLSHHVLVSRSQNKIYFSYNGGPVFRLDQPPPKPQEAAAAGADGQAAAGAASGAAPADAESLARQGDALMSRREYAAALELFDKAVELEPKEPRRYVERARARLALNRSILAMADLDHALELKPDFPGALFGRGELFLRNGDLVRADQDFTAALKAAPDDATLRLRIAGAYVRNAKYERAIAQYDAWIGEHPHDDILWEGLHGRCAARAAWGKELDKALEDCDAALRKGPRSSVALDTRGLVRLRLGQLREAVADYDAALKLQPKLAAALYGRGLAKQRLGQTAEGDADIAAAVAIEPNLTARFRRLGVTEAKAKVAQPKTDAPKAEPAKSEPLKAEAGQPKG